MASLHISFQGYNLVLQSHGDDLMIRDLLQVLGAFCLQLPLLPVHVLDLLNLAIKLSLTLLAYLETLHTDGFIKCRLENNNGFPQEFLAIFTHRSIIKILMHNKFLEQLSWPILLQGEVG